ISLKLEESKDEKITEAIKIVDEQILTSNLVESFAELLITDLISLTKEDLEMWEDDPEGWINYDETDHWEYQLRPCAEKVFIELLTQYRNSLSVKIAKLLENFASRKRLLCLDIVLKFIVSDEKSIHDGLNRPSWSMIKTPKSGTF
ncbi:16641_t:CDS:2, partial [Acaulospora morrowiae]